MAENDIKKLINKLRIPKVQISIVPLVASIILLLMAAFSYRSPGFQTLMKFIVCGSAGYLAYLCKGLKNDYWLWGFILIAILFNPIAPVWIEHDMRGVLYLGVAILFAAIVYIRSAKD